MRRANCQLLVVALLAAMASAVPSVARAADGTSTAVVSLPDGARVAGLAVGAGAVWVANGRAGTVARLDPRTNQVVATIPVGEPSPGCDRCWGAVAARGEVVWAAMDTAGPVVVRIDPLANSIAEIVEVGVLPAALAVDKDGGLWLTATLENAVVHVDPHGGRAVSRLTVHLPSGIAAGPDAIWVAARTLGSTGQVVGIDPRTDLVLATIPVGRDPGALAVGDADVWVTNDADHTVSRVDPRAKATIATIPVVHFPIGAVIGEGAVWIASRGAALLSQPAISRIDVDTNTVVETTAMGGTAPIGMAAGDTSLWIASRSPDEVLRIGPIPLRPVAPAAGGPPTAVALGGGAILVLAIGEVLRRLARQGDQPMLLPVRHPRRVTVRRCSTRCGAGHQGGRTDVVHRSAGVLPTAPPLTLKMVGPRIREGQLRSRRHSRVPRPRLWKVGAWSLVLGSTLALTALFHAVASSALGGPSAAAPTPVRLSPATAASAYGDEMRVGLLADPPAANCTTQPLYAGQRSWVEVHRHPALNRRHSRRSRTLEQASPSSPRAYAA